MFVSYFGSLIANSEESSPRSMERPVDKKFTWVINNFSSLQSEKIYSDQFVVGGCKWYLMASKGKYQPNNLSLYLEVADPESLPYGWKRHTKVSFTIVNPILQNLSQLRAPDIDVQFAGLSRLMFNSLDLSYALVGNVNDDEMNLLCGFSETQHWFNDKSLAWGFPSMFPLSELHPKDSEFLVNGALKIVAEVDVLEVIGKLDESEESEEASSPLNIKGSMEVNGFQVLPSQVKSVNCLFERHPDIASKLRIKNQHLKTGYMNVLLSLTETLRQSPQQISKDDLADAYAALGSLVDVGFRLDWLEKILDEMSEKKEKVEACQTRVQELEEELKDLKHKCSDVEALLEMEKAELLGARAPLSYDDII